MFLRTILQASAILPFFYTTATAQTACNNSPSLCNRAYNNITHLGAHDSAFVRDESTSFSTSGNQYYSTTVQLDAGVRLLSAQVHKFTANGQTEWHLCHSSCDLLDAGPLSSWLRNISNWMDNHPTDVVTILLVNSDNAPAATLGAQFASSGIDKHAYKPPSSSSSSSSIPPTWPTLQSLISNQTRLLTFVASLSQPSPQYPYLMDEFTYIFENAFENTSPANFSCAPDRPNDLATPQQASQSGRMFLMNHFLYSVQAFNIQSPNSSYVNVTNAQTGVGSLGKQISECGKTYSKNPNFVLVDFFNVGPAIASVDSANGVTGAVGRKSVSSQALVEIDSAASVGRGSVGLVVLAVSIVVGLGL
jgi:hypothetical protein